MFESSADGFTKAVSAGRYVRVPDLISATQCSLLQLAVKTRRFIPFRKPKYSVTDFQISQLFTDEEAFKVTVGVDKYPNSVLHMTSISSPLGHIFPLNPVIETPAPLVPEPGYKRVAKVNLHGKFKAELKQVFENELDHVVSIDSNVDLGVVNLHAVSLESLITCLANRKFSLDHPLISQVKKVKRTSLCVITGVALTQAEGNIHYTLNIGGKGLVSTEGIFHKCLKGDAEEDISDVKDRSLPLPPQTALCFEPCELKVATDGSLKLLILPQLRGGFAQDVTDAPTAAEEQVDDEVLLKGLLDLKEDVRKEKQQAFRDLGKDALSLGQVGAILDVGSTIDALTSKKPLTETSTNFLKAMNFAVDNKGSPVPPQESCDQALLQTAQAIMDAMLNCGSIVLSQLLLLSEHEADVLYSEIRKSLKGIQAGGPMDGPAMKNLLIILGFEFDSSAINSFKEDLDDLISDIMFLLKALY